MSRIMHIALKVDDLEAATRFYVDVFGFRELDTSSRDGHTSRHLSDGTTDLALMKYESEEMPEALWAGPGQCIHHFGLEVEDKAVMADRIAAAGCEILSKPGSKGALKFRTPHGIVAELIQKGGLSPTR